MFWKIYFWLIVFITTVGTFSLYPTLPKANLAFWSGLVEGVVGLIGIFSYTYRQHIFSSIVWRVIFIYLSVLWTNQLFYYSNILPQINKILRIVEVQPSNQGFIGVAFSIILFLPALYAIYRLGFLKK